MIGVYDRKIRTLNTKLQIFDLWIQAIDCFISTHSKCSKHCIEFPQFLFPLKYNIFTQASRKNIKNRSKIIFTVGIKKIDFGESF